MIIGYNEFQMERARRRFEAQREEFEANRRLLAEGKTPLELDSRGRVEKRLRRIGFDELARELAPERAMAPARARQALADHDEPSRMALERVLGRNNLTSISYIARARQAARAVGRVRVRTNLGWPNGFGTGFLISPHLMLTNHHVLGSVEEARPSLFELDFEEGPFGAMRQSTLFPLDPDRFFVADEERDLAVVAVAPSTTGRQPREFGWHPLIGAIGKVLVGEPLNIIQHPNGGPKQIAFRDNRLLLLTENPDFFLQYETDTEPGSSGSPVFNDAWEVVALHHAGVPAKDEQGRYLAEDCTLWQPGKPAKWVSNEGVRASRIVAFLKDQNLQGKRRDLLEQALTLRPPRLEEQATGPREPAKVVDFHLPMQVSFGPNGAQIDIGAPSVLTSVGDQGPAAPAPGSQPDAPAPPLNPSGPGPSAPPPLQPGDVAYYDASRDEREAREYYRGVDVNALPEGLFDQLSGLVRSTHQRQVRYRQARLDHLYPNVDLHPDGLLRSVYSEQSFEPRELIQMELALEAQLERRRFELLAAETTLSDADLDAELDLLEQQQPFNCEHVVPQSWYNKREPMRGDMHHLFTCEYRCNSFRSNHPYTDFADFDEAVRSNCGKVDDHNFEPGHGKGAVARATLYFLLRYPGFIDDDAREFSRDRLPILLDWHQAEPPQQSLWELHRNQSIFGVQGNRNPLIDRPEWAERVDFRKGLG